MIERRGIRKQFFYSPKDDNAPVSYSNQSSDEGQLMAELFSLAGRKPNRDLNKEHPPTSA